MALWSIISDTAYLN